MDTLDKILDLLKTRKIEQKEFAKAIGLQKQAVTDWKKGTTKSYLRYIDQIADYFGVSTDYLLGKTDISQPKNDLHDIVYDDFIYAIYLETRELPERDKTVLLEMAKVLNRIRKGNSDNTNSDG